MNPPLPPPSYTISLTTDRSSAKDVVKGLLHTIFFHRYFTPLYPATHEILDLTLPYVSEDDIESLLETRSTELLRTLERTNTTSAATAQVVIQFSEKKRRKGWFITTSKNKDEDIAWETWVINITSPSSPPSSTSELEAARMRRQTGRNLERAVMKVLGIVNREREHIPPITTNEANPFPYAIVVASGHEAGGKAAVASGGAVTGGGMMGLF